MSERGPVLGVALSGGGFRAAYFHIGVLARMAEQGLLRRAAFLSTVSGGAIIGALYYLFLKRLLESKADHEITDQDYCDLVARMERHFTAAVQKNMRMRTFLNPVKNLRMARANYSRSDRIGELYDTMLYRPVLHPGGTEPVRLRELKIRPKQDRSDFHPLRHNTGRAALVPVLIVNATSLNTGRNWRFEAARMGEPPRQDPSSNIIDKVFRLERPPSYVSIPPHQQDFGLGHAVAASSCVPGIFHPLAVSGLYPDVRLQLVDGGVHDNQGIEALVDRGCTHFVVSDASGQLEGEREPGTGIASVLGRMSSLLMHRVREEQLRLLFARQRSGTFAFVHLRHGLSPEHVPYLTETGQAPVLEEADVSTHGSQTAPEVQEALARVRTDLDAFTDVEAFSLMCNGFQIGSHALRQLNGLPRPERPLIARWRFQAVAPWMTRPTPAYLRQLRAASMTVGKVFRLSKGASVLTLAVVGACMAVVVLAFPQLAVQLWSTSIPLGPLAGIAAVWLLSRHPTVQLAWQAITWIRHPTAFFARLATRSLLPLAGSLFVWIWLTVYLPVFLRSGRLNQLRPPNDRPRRPAPATGAANP